MARYSTDDLEYLERGSRHGRNRPEPHVEYIDSRGNELGSALAPSYVDEYHRTSSRGVGALIRQPPPVVEEPVVEHEHHHLHHHIDHGDVSGRMSMSRISRPSVGRQYSYDDLDVKRRQLPNGSVVTQVHHEHDHRHRHRHRHRSRSSRWQSMESRSSRFARSDIDLGHRGSFGGLRGDYDDDYIHEDYTVVDVPPGSRRVYVNVDNNGRRSDRDFEVDWRREHGVRRSRGLGNELWTEITKDLVCREAIEELGYQFEETDFFYYIFEYLDREELAELRELTDMIRHERVRDIEYQSISGGSQIGSMPRMLRGGRGYDDIDDTRTEIIIENGGSSRRSGRRKYYNY